MRNVYHFNCAIQVWRHGGREGTVQGARSPKVAISNFTENGQILLIIFHLVENFLKIIFGFISKKRDSLLLELGRFEQCRRE